MPPRKDKKLSLDDPSAWDDSSLVQAWEQVFEDYKDMQNQEEKQESKSNEKNTGKKRRKIASTKKEQSFEAPEEASNEATLAEIGEECFTQAQEEEPKQDSTFAVPVEPQINLPTGFPGLEDEKDENLSNMMMAWYYAGYYTGVYQANKKRKRL